MRRLDGTSSFMIHVETSRCYQHTLKIALLDWDANPEGYRYEKLVATLERWIELYPMLKWKLKKAPLGINHPIWVQDLNYDFLYHVRRIACPAPGDKSTFGILVSQLYSQRLDRSHPLWMLWIVEGLENNRVALVGIFHHAYADGIGFSKVLEALSPAVVREPRCSRDYGVDPEKDPSAISLLLRNIIDLPRLFWRGIPPVVRSVLRQRRLEREFVAKGGELPPFQQHAPDSPLNAAYSSRRTFAYEIFDLTDVRAIAQHFGVTINDLFVAIVAGAVRRYYLANGFTPDASLVAAIPMNYRTEEEKDEILGNYVGFSYMWAAVHLEDPVERLRFTAKSSGEMKAYTRATGGAGWTRALELMPPLVPFLMNWILDRSKGKAKLAGNMIISNVRGPAAPLCIGGAKIASWLSIGHVAAGVGLNVTAWSYVNEFGVCLLAEAKVVPDGGAFMDYVTASFNEYKGFCSAPASLKAA